MKTIILTQETCPQCDSLKMFLFAATKDQFKDNITYVQKEAEPVLFADLVAKSGVTQTPSLLFIEEDSNDILEIISGFNPSRTKSRLEQYYLKK